MGLFTHVHDVVSAFAAGKLVLIVDEERENEGDVAVAAHRVTGAAITFMATQARGLICIPMLGSRLDTLELPLMVGARPSMDVPAFTVSVDARAGVTSGVSAEDRARTVRALIDPTTRPDDLIRPGHIFPLRYTEGGVLTRCGHTEAAVDLAKLAGCYPAAVICEVMNDDGTMADKHQLKGFAERHRLMVINISDLCEYLRRTQAAARPQAATQEEAEDLPIPESPPEPHREPAPSAPDQVAEG